MNKKYRFTALFSAIKLLAIALLSLVFLQACTPSAGKPLQRYQHSIEGSYAGDISNDGKWSVISSIHHGVSVWDLEKTL